MNKFTSLPEIMWLLWFKKSHLTISCPLCLENRPMTSILVLILAMILKQIQPSMWNSQQPPLDLVMPYWSPSILLSIAMEMLTSFWVLMRCFSGLTCLTPRPWRCWWGALVRQLLRRKMDQLSIRFAIFWSLIPLNAISTWIYMHWIFKGLEIMESRSLTTWEWPTGSHLLTRSPSWLAKPRNP